MRKTAFLLLAVLLLGAGLRFTGIDYGLPLLRPRIDEGIYLSTMKSIAREGSLDPKIYNYPGLALYSFYALQRGYHGVCRAAGTDIGAMTFLEYVEGRPDRVFLVNRLASALIGTLTILLTFLLARTLAGARAGLVAAFLLAGAYLSVREAHFGLVDTPMAFMVMLSLILIHRASQRGTIGSLVLASAVSGLATAFKYPAATLCFPITVAVVCTGHARGESWIRAFFSPRLALAAFVMVAAFLAGAPYTVIHFNEFLYGFGHEVVHFQAESYDAHLERGWIHHVAFNLRWGLGLPLLAAMGLSLLGSLARPRRGLMVVAAFVVGFYLVMGIGRTTLIRYVVPLVPPLAVLTGWALAGLVSRVSARRVGAVLLVAVPIVLSSVSLYRCGLFCRAMMTEDSRLVAGRWLAEHVGRDETIMAWGDLAAVLPDHRVIEYNPAALVRGRARYLVVRDHLPWTLLGLDRILEAGVSAERVHAVAARTPEARPVYDPIEGVFLVPFVGHAGLIRPGPNVDIYRVAALDSSPAPPPSAPTDLKVAIEPPDIRLTWKPAANADDVVCYLVYVASTEAMANVAELAPVAFVAGDAHSLHIPMVPPGRYLVGVTALGIGGESNHAITGCDLK